jgi:HSP20 family protein
MTKEMQKTNENGGNGERNVRTVVPAVDIQELADSFVVRLDIPGAEKESIAARVSNSTMTVDANVSSYFKQEATLMVDDSLPTEYHREFSLADNIDLQSIDAAYELGVLKITLKKKQQYLPRQITIQ